MDWWRACVTELNYSKCQSVRARRCPHGCARCPLLYGSVESGGVLWQTSMLSPSSAKTPIVLSRPFDAIRCHSLYPKCSVASSFAPRSSFAEKARRCVSPNPLALQFATLVLATRLLLWLPWIMNLQWRQISFPDRWTWCLRDPNYQPVSWTHPLAGHCQCMTGIVNQVVFRIGTPHSKGLPALKSVHVVSSRKPAWLQLGRVPDTGLA